MKHYQIMIRFVFSLIVLSWAIAMTVPAKAGELVVTRYFSGLWDQPRQEAQGIMLQIIDQEEDGKKKAVAYWFTYGDDLNTAWYMAIGHVEGDQVVMKLYTSEGVAFMEDDAFGNDSVYTVGTLVLSFHNCNKGIANYETSEAIGSGEFEIKRLAALYNSRCSGGISDDTPSNARPIMLDVDLEPAREGITGKGKAKFWERVDRSDFHVSAEDIDDGKYSILVCTKPVGSLTVVSGEGSTQFRSPETDGTENLYFKPRDCPIEIHDGLGAVLTSGEDVLAPKNNGKQGGGNGNNGNGKKEIEVDLDNLGFYPDAEGEASYLEKNNSVEFEVEIKGVPAGTYTLDVMGQYKGDIIVAPDDDDDDTLKGKIRFSNPQKDERELLNFDPRGQLVEVYEDSDRLFELFFPQ
ncbi:hypothetical protein ACFL07_03395 [Pseudomonadota bacterium]